MVAQQSKAQTIVIDSTFTSDGEIFPFSQNDTIYGLSISGTVTLSSDTSLVRVILSDTSGNEWMVYEAYPMIVTDSSFDILEECDETCYLEELAPNSIKIQILNANIKIDSVNFTVEGIGDMSTLQLQSKSNKDAQKTSLINQSINEKGWDWVADTTSIVKMFFHEKINLFRYKYNLLGLDYYAGGAYMNDRLGDGMIDTTDFTKSFDWRKKHDAHMDTSFYFDGNLDRHVEPNKVIVEQGNGWMTGIRDQRPCGACVAFSSVASMEAIVNLYFNQHIDSTFGLRLSERHAYNCTPNGVLLGCECIPGGKVWAGSFFSFFVEEGIVTEYCYPWREPFCDGDFGDCSENDSICVNPDTVLLSNGIGYISTSSPDPVVNMKKTLIKYGPLTINVDEDCFQTHSSHAVSLVGFFTDSNNVIQWIMKNSWGAFTGDTGYFTWPLSFSDLSPLMYYFKTSIETIDSGLFTKKSFDKDKDGYYNWGIGPKPENLISCKEEEDSNDNDNRTGPYDTTTYIGLPVMPEIVVTNRWIFNADTIKNGGYYYFEGDTINDTILTFYISNPGTAQLNLDRNLITNDGIITIGDEFPPGQFEIQDRPDTSICMNDDTTTFKIKLKHGAEDGSLALVQIHLNEPDMDSIFEFTLVFNGCETESGYDSVNTVVSWSDSCRTQNKDLHIQRYGVLSISGTVLLSPEADIIVEQGGKLVIDGGKLTRSCEDELWNGIQVWGDSSLSQYPDTNQGFVQIKNNGCIEYARTGIFTGRFDNEEALYNYSGGIVVAEEAIFLNNEVDVEFLPFINDHPSSFKEIDNFSGFRRCTFKTFDPGLVLHAPIAHAILDGVSGIDFSACAFTTQEVPGHPFEDDDKGTGILLYDSYIYVKPMCSTPVIPCEDYDSCCFKNLRYGIRAFNTGANKFFSVKEAKFDGNIAEGINKGDSTGLCLKCNDFRTCLNDMLVIEGDTTGRYMGIKENQGADTTLTYALAGNTFTSEIQSQQAIDNGGNYKSYWSYFNNADNINYYHHTYNPIFIMYPSEGNFTDETITLHDQIVNFVKDTACPSALGGAIYKNCNDPRLEIAEADLQLIPFRYSYNILLDGGNTEALDFEIITSFPDEALELRQQLLADSPYLSDTIIKQAIYKENVLPNAMIRDVLAANPQSAKSNEILDAVDGRYDPMPDYMMADIMQGLDQIGALESLESKIGYWKQYRSKAINRLIREYLTDSTIIDREDSLNNLFQNESSLQSKYRLAFTYWENNQLNDALDVLEDIPTTFDLTSDKQNIHQDYLDYFDILQMMKDSNLNAHELDSSAIQSLLTIMNEGQPLISAYARGMLLKGRHIDYAESIAFPTAVKSYPGYYYLDPQKIDFPEEEHLVLFPNPSGDFVIAYFNTLDFDELGMLAITNNQGKQLVLIKLPSEKNQLIIDLSSFPNGAYLVSLLINNQKIETKKLIKAGA